MKIRDFVVRHYAALYFAVDISFKHCSQSMYALHTFTLHRTNTDQVSLSQPLVAIVSHS